MRKFWISLLLVVVMFGMRISFATAVENPDYKWISPKETYVTSNLVIPISINIGRKATLKIEIYKMAGAEVAIPYLTEQTAKDPMDIFNESAGLLERILMAKTEKIMILDENGKETDLSKKVGENKERADKSPSEKVSLYEFQASIENLKAGELGIFNHEVSLSAPGEYIFYVYVQEQEDKSTILQRKVKVVDYEEAKKYIDVYNKVLELKNKLGSENK